MENIATKKFSYDHLTSYKTRGKLGASNRNVRVQRANENRHLSRMDEVSKRRRMPLSPLVDENAIDTINGEIQTKDGKSLRPRRVESFNRRYTIKSTVLKKSITYYREISLIIWSL